MCPARQSAPPCTAPADPLRTRCRSRRNHPSTQRTESPQKLGTARFAQVLSSVCIGARGLDLSRAEGLRFNLTAVKAAYYDCRNLFLVGGFVRRKSAGRVAAVYLLAALVRPETARASLPRLVVGDLHGEADLKEIGVATQILVGAALERSGAVHVVPRPEVIAAFQGI